MKTKLITALLCTSLVSTSMAGDDWDMFRKAFYGKDASHTWQNIDGSKTYRYDSPGSTTFETRSAQSVQNESEFKQGLAAVGVLAVLVVINAIFNGGNTAPQQPNYNYGR